MDNKNKRPIVSLCLPTNGVSEWVFPVLDSIYTQGVLENLFEVIVTDNGSNNDFREKIEKYKKQHTNLIYKKTEAYLFNNQLEALKLASGIYLKFVNHRSVFKIGALQHILGVIETNNESKPVIYFSCGELTKEIYRLKSFDEFVSTLGHFASWTTGVGIWKDDYDRIPMDIKFDKISPHSAILFSEKNKESYIIDNFKFAEEIDTNHSKKGKYDLFKAFAVEELTITLNLYIDGDITASTFKKVKKDYKKFLCGLYSQFCIRHKPCSYDLSGFNDSMGIFYTKKSIIIGAYLHFFKALLKKIFRLFAKKGEVR